MLARRRLNLNWDRWDRRIYIVILIVKIGVKRVTIGVLLSYMSRFALKGLAEKDLR